MLLVKPFSVRRVVKDVTNICVRVELCLDFLLVLELNAFIWASHVMKVALHAVIRMPGESDGMF